MNEERTGKCLRQVNICVVTTNHNNEFGLRYPSVNVSQTPSQVLVFQRQVAMSFLINLLQKLYGSHVTMQTNIPTVLGGVRVTRSLVVCVCVGDRCLSFCTFSFVHCVVYPSSIYGF